MVTPVFRRGNPADLEAAGPLDAQTVARIAADIGSALAFAHQRVVHRALTPASVQIDDEHHAFVGDFDVASRAWRDVAPVTDMTLPISELADIGVNARRYASPEQLAGGSAPCDPTSTPWQSCSPRLSPAFTTTWRACCLRFPSRSASSSPGATSHDRTLEVPRRRRIHRRVPRRSDAHLRHRLLLSRTRTRASDRSTSRTPQTSSDATASSNDCSRFLGDTGSRGRFVVVVGPRSGKSSVVKAGLLPALRRGALPGSAEWYAVTVTPGAHPYEELEAALLRVAVNPPVSLLDELTTGSEGIRHAVRRATRRTVVAPGRARPVRGTLHPNARARRPQVPERAGRRRRGSAGSAPRWRRCADCYDRPLQHLAISDLVRRGTEVLTPMTPNELERAIDGPAERWESASSLGSSPRWSRRSRHGQVRSLLQYYSTELFDHRDGAVISASAYHETGGVSGALARRAEALFDELLAPAQRRRAKSCSVSSRSGTVGRASAGGSSASSPPWATGPSTLCSTRSATTACSARPRQVVSCEPTVEIAHEALLTGVVEAEALDRRCPRPRTPPAPSGGSGDGVGHRRA